MLRKFIVALHLENWCKSLPSLPTYSSISSFHKMLKCTTSRLADSHSHKPTRTVRLEKLKFQTNIYSWRLNTFVGDLVTFWSCFLGQIIGPQLRWNKTWLNRCVYVAAPRQVWRRKTRKQDNRENNSQNMSSRKCFSFLLNVGLKPADSRIMKLSFESTNVAPSKATEKYLQNLLLKNMLWWDIPATNLIDCWIMGTVWNTCATTIALKLPKNVSSAGCIDNSLFSCCCISSPE